MGGELISFDVEKKREEVEEQALAASANAAPIKQRGQKRGRSDDDSVDDPTPRSKRRMTTTTTKNNPKGRRTVAPCPSDRSVRVTSDPSMYQDETCGSSVGRATAFDQGAPDIFTWSIRGA